jgi:glycosyltransferase involved in cell wall biosynthesis
MLEQNRIGFIGFTLDSAAVLRSLDVVVHASTKREPFGRSVVEAMACGCAVIASNAGGVEEISQIAGRDSMLMFEPGNCQQLTDRISLVATDSSARAKLQAAGITAARLFDRNQLLDNLLEFYSLECAK